MNQLCAPDRDGASTDGVIRWQGYKIWESVLDDALIESHEQWEAAHDAFLETIPSGHVELDSDDMAVRDGIISQSLREALARSLAMYAGAA